MSENRTDPQMPFDSCLPEEARQHLRAARKEFRKSIEALLPQGFVTHQKRARKEMLLAWRSLIDTALERLEESESKAA
jgi:hypothetical protein